MEYIIICVFALIGYGLTLFSGFGLGTLLMPVFALFFPVDIAIALTAIVHFANNLIKLTIFGKNINWKIALSFGVPSIVTALVGAYLLKILSEMDPVFSFSISGKFFNITPVKLIISVLLLFFAITDVFPQLLKIRFEKNFFRLADF